MERLTRKSETSDMVWFIDCEHKSGYAEREPCEMDAHHARLAIARLAEYEDLEEQGKLLKLPCTVGDTVYEINQMRNTVSEFVIEGFSVSEYGVFIKWILINGIYNNLSGFNDDEIGKTVFFTKESAESALKELNGKERIGK